MPSVYIKLGEKATSFFDPQTGLKIANKQVAEVEQRVTLYPKVKNALRGGHLVKISKDEAEELHEDTQSSTENKEKIKATKVKPEFTASTKPDELAKAYTLKELTEIAATYEIEVEKTDTKMDIVEAILAEISE